MSDGKWTINVGYDNAALLSYSGHGFMMDSVMSDYQLSLAEKLVNDANEAEVLRARVQELEQLLREKSLTELSSLGQKLGLID